MKRLLIPTTVVGAIAAASAVADSSHADPPPPHVSASPVHDCAHPPPPRPKSHHYPNGGDIITCEQTASGEKWKIERPYISAARTAYPWIKFKPGDIVEITASGCAQHGGLGHTWKRYVNPKNRAGGSDDKYFGVLEIKGVTPTRVPYKDDDPGMVRIEHWQGLSFAIPEPSHLILGYVDDGYGDNGYEAHDDGVHDQCKGSHDAVVHVSIRHAPTPNCQETLRTATVQPMDPAITKLKALLQTHADVDIGSAITPDTPGGGLTHFQRFDHGVIAARPDAMLDSVETHADGCVYAALTPTKAPYWYPVDYAFDDKGHFKNRIARPWDGWLTGKHGKMSLFEIEDHNRTETHWGDALKRAECGGAPGPSRGISPRWVKVCPPAALPPSAWTLDNVHHLKAIATTTPQAKDTGAKCGWQKASPDIGHQHSCGPMLPHDEWTAFDGEHPRVAEGIITTSFLSGGDVRQDHEEMPDSNWLGVHTDGDMHNSAVNNCGNLGIDLEGGDKCVDWEMNLTVDPQYRRLLAPNEHHAQNDPKKYCQGRKDYRLGNWVEDLKGNLGLEMEQWALPAGYRPEAGDRAHVRGRWIVDCGHPNWQTELHPMHLIVSSFLQTGAPFPTIALSRNMPPIVHHWRTITGGAVANVTKVLVTRWWFEKELEFDVWPPARPSATARLDWKRDALADPDAMKHVHIVETPEPKDNPNHIHVVVTREGNAPGGPKHGPYGQIKPNSDAHLATAYMAWWK